MTKKYLSADQRWGRWHWIRVLGLTYFYFPFWRSVNGIRRGVIAMRGHVNLVSTDELMTLTAQLDEHPEGWNHPCMCAECRTHG